MVKPREDKLKRYWKLIDLLDLEAEYEDFEDDGFLQKAIELMEDMLKKKQEGEKTQ